MNELEMLLAMLQRRNQPQPELSGIPGMDPFMGQPPSGPGPLPVLPQLSMPPQGGPQGLASAAAGQFMGQSQFPQGFGMADLANYGVLGGLPQQGQQAGQKPDWMKLGMSLAQMMQGGEQRQQPQMPPLPPMPQGMQRSPMQIPTPPTSPGFMSGLADMLRQRTGAQIGPQEMAITPDLIMQYLRQQTGAAAAPQEVEELMRRYSGR